MPVVGWLSVIALPSPTQYAVLAAVSFGNCTRPFGGSATSCAPAAANTSRLRCRSISSPSIGSGTIEPPAVSVSVPSAFRSGFKRRPIQSASSGSNLLGVRGHLLVQFVAQPLALRLEHRQVRRRERHEERLLPVVRRRTRSRRTGRGVAGARGSLPSPGPGRRTRARTRRPSARCTRRSPGHTGPDVTHGTRRSTRAAFSTARRGLLLDERHQLVAGLELVGRRRGHETPSCRVGQGFAPSHRGLWK